MRIDAYNKVSQLYNTANVKKTTKSNSGGVSDKLEISQKGRSYRVAKQIVAQVPDERVDKINQIKERIESGTYNISMTEVADKVVSRYFDELI
jgi:negative regulator of flagellin synthesis FlgM